MIFFENPQYVEGGFFCYTKPIFCVENLYEYYTFFYKKVKYLKGYSIVTALKTDLLIIAEIL